MLGDQSSDAELRELMKRYDDDSRVPPPSWWDEHQGSNARASSIRSRGGRDQRTNARDVGHTRRRGGSVPQEYHHSNVPDLVKHFQDVLSVRPNSIDDGGLPKWYAPSPYHGDHEYPATLVRLVRDGKRLVWKSGLSLPNKDGPQQVGERKRNQTFTCEHHADKRQRLTATHHELIETTCDTNIIGTSEETFSPDAKRVRTKAPPATFEELRKRGQSLLHQIDKIAPHYRDPATVSRVDPSEYLDVRGARAQLYQIPCQEATCIPEEPCDRDNG